MTRGFGQPAAANVDASLPARIESEADIAAALVALQHLDPRLRPVVAAAGEVPLRRNPPGLKGLVFTMIGQQVSRASAMAIFERLDASLDVTDHHAILAAPDTVFRAAGLSRAKHKTILAVAASILSGELDLSRVASSSSEEAVAELVRVPGIGPWTAESYLLFCLGHPDVFPAGDLALQVAVAAAFDLGERPSARALKEIALGWAPHRATAARLFWAYYRTLTRREAAPVGIGS
ncbi:DNA-3-methyladenine glycosylase family protein [Consotaella salsifontis]|uniref:DNA-3-methyladenine glycosylase II n=1 Tax=Consotaella salsifontis TaxID=1365950 RepID=A0A1T4RS63_9HYPH|nr:DNA-3-methyladenine glycosylase 2 family protein [Consotaella salsifontis]SKA18819.1 DNA-3-methyladenine glycosylase II [Consotaella salsifontis]